MIETRVGPKEMLRALSPETYVLAKSSMVSLSTFLERGMIRPEGEDKQIDAFTRLLMEADVRTRTIEEEGLYASTFEELADDKQKRWLIPELMQRWWKSGTRSSAGTRSLFGSQDAPAPGAANLVTYATTGRLSQMIAPAIPLSELVALTTPINTGSYSAYYLTQDATQQRRVRIAEGAEVPRMRLIGGDHDIKLKKYGRALEVTYEAMRRQRIDRIALAFQLMAAQAEIDKVAAVIDVCVNGDGNASTAATNYNLTALDTGATAGTLTLKGWLAFKMKFANPYALTVAIAQEATALQMLMLNAGSANIPLVMIAGASGFGSFRQINPGLADGAGLGWTSDAPSGKIVGIDARYAIERVTEIGADITEIERFITRQTQAIVMTDNEAYLKFDTNAVRTLNVAA